MFVICIKLQLFHSRIDRFSPNINFASYFFLYYVDIIVNKLSAPKLMVKKFQY